LRVQSDDGAAVLFEIDPPSDVGGFGDVAFEGAYYKAKETLEQTLTDVRAIALKALDTFRAGSRRPDAVELEFGVKFTAEAGAAVFAKTAAEGHIVVRLSWSGDRAGTAESDDE
jgi:hypothetical protein